MSPIVFSPPPASVGVSPVPRTSLLVTVPEDFMLFNAAVMNQTQPESSPSLMGSLAGGRLPAIPLTPSQATLQLQHDAGLILSNVHVLQQLVTSLNRTSSDVLLAVHGRQPFPSSAIQQVMPAYRVRCAAHYMMAMGSWRPPVDAGIRTPLPSAACNACTSCQDCFPDVPV